MTGHVLVPGLTPSATLSPGATLAPQGPVYSGGPITPHQIALACGVGGTYIDVTAYVEFGEGVGYTYGRPDQFSDPTPGTFSFTLNNADGRFTPGNPGSPLATTVTEGMGVSWLLGTRLTHFSILAVEIPASDDTWYQLRVTCDDMLGDAGRHELTSIADGLTAIESPQLWWKFDDTGDTGAAVEVNGSPLGSFTNTTGTAGNTPDPITFGVEQIPALPGTAVTVTSVPGDTSMFGTARGNATVRTNIAYPIPTNTGVQYYFGWWSLWIYPGSTGTFRVWPHWAVGAGYGNSIQTIFTPTGVSIKGGIATASGYTYTSAEQSVPHYVSVRPYISWQSSGSYWALFMELWLDGRFLTQTFFQSSALGYVIPDAMLADGTAMQPVEVSMSVPNPSGSTGNLSATFQRVVHTLNPGLPLEQNALLNVEDERRAVLDTLSTELSSAAYNGRPSLSRAEIGYPDIANRSVLDVYNDIVRSEQGHLFCTTTGSLLAPVEQIQMRDRDRPTVVKAAFRATDGAGLLNGSELDGLPAFVRDITNVAESVDVAGPTATVTVEDPTVLAITSRAVTAGLSETVLFAHDDDLRLWGQDRIARGKNIGIRISQFTVDAVTTPTDRSKDLTGLVPGDRVQVYGLPAAVLGFTAWDGWLLGATESHNQDASKFTLTVAPVLPNPGVYDGTDRYENDSDGYVNVTCTATQPTIAVSTYTGAGFSTDVPYTIQIDTEQLTVTAVSGGTLTVTRGVNGTTAATHQSGAAISAPYSPVYAY